MMRNVLLAGMAVWMASLITVTAQNNRLGAGVHYWRAVDSIDVEDVDEDGLAYVITYQRVLSDLLKLQADVELYPDNFGGSTESVYAPQAFLLLGGGLYGGLGVGVDYSDGVFADKPFYIVRAGLDLEVLPAIRLDINANYRFVDFDEISDLDETIDTDVVTLGAAVRFEF